MHHIYRNPSLILSVFFYTGQAVYSEDYQNSSLLCLRLKLIIVNRRVKLWVRKAKQWSYRRHTDEENYRIRVVILSAFIAISDQSCKHLIRHLHKNTD